MLYTPEKTAALQVDCNRKFRRTGVREEKQLTLLIGNQRKVLAIMEQELATEITGQGDQSAQFERLKIQRVHRKNDCEGRGLTLRTKEECE